MTATDVTARYDFVLHRLPAYDGAPVQLMASGQVWAPAVQDTRILMRPESGHAATYYELQITSLKPAEEWPGWLQFNVFLTINAMPISGQWMPARLYDTPADIPSMTVRFPEHTETYKDAYGANKDITPGVWLLTGRRGL